MRTSYRILTPLLLAAFIATGCESAEMTAPEEGAQYSIAMAAIVPGTRESAQQQANVNAKPNANAHPNAHAAAGGGGKGSGKGKDKNPSQNQPPPSSSPAAPDVTDSPVVNQPSEPAIPNALVDLDFSKATSRAQALAMLEAAGGGVEEPGGTTASALSRIGFAPGQGLVQLQPAGSAASPYIVFRKIGARRSVWVSVERKFSSGWTTQGEKERAAGYKVEGCGWQGLNGDARLEITHGTQYQLTFGVPGMPARFLDVRTMNSELDNRFHTFVRHYASSGESASWRYWIDGSRLTGVDPQTKIPSDGIYSRIPGGAPLVDRCGVGMNFNKVRLKDQHIVIRRIIILDGTAQANPWNLR